MLIVQQGEERVPIQQRGHTCDQKNSQAALATRMYIVNEHVCMPYMYTTRIDRCFHKQRIGSVDRVFKYVYTC